MPPFTGGMTAFFLVVPVASRLAGRVVVVMLAETVVVSSPTLHPNLAKLASSYDDIVSQFERNAIDADEARARISALVARDDNGVQWRIGYDDGEWYRQDMDGKMRVAVPPSWGVATETGFDLSDGPDPLGDPRRNIWHAPVSIGGAEVGPPQMRHLLNESAASWEEPIDAVAVGHDFEHATIAAAAAVASPAPLSLSQRLAAVDRRLVFLLLGVLSFLLALRLLL